MIYIKPSLTLTEQYLKRLSVVFLVVSGSLFFTNSAYAVSFSFDSAPNVATMLINLSEAVPNLMRLGTALAYVMGFFFVVNGILELKQYGESRSMMSHEHSLAKPLTYLAVGAMLIYLPATVQTGLSTFWGEP